MTKNVAVAIMGYNRVDYLKSLIDSICKTNESRTLPFYFFIDGDGGKNIHHAEVERIVMNSHIANKQIIFRKTNIGCGRNHIEAKMQLFEIHDGLFILEDDLVIAKNFFKIIALSH